MEDYIIWISLILSIIEIILGLYICFNKKLKARVNFKEVWQLFWIVFVLHIFDVLSTIYFVNKIGVEYEGNIIARNVMIWFGTVPGLLLFFIITLPILFFTYVFINYLFKNHKLGWKIYAGIIITINIIIPIYNLTA